MMIPKIPPCPMCRAEIVDEGRERIIAAGLAVQVERVLKCKNCTFAVVVSRRISPLENNQSGRL